MTREFAVVVLTPDGNKAVCPFVGSDLELYSFLFDWYLDTDETTPGGMPWLVYETDWTGTPITACLEIPDWLDRAEAKLEKRYGHFA